MLVALSCIQTLFGETSPNYKEYELKYGGFYFNKLDVGNQWSSKYVYELVDADDMERLEIPDSVENLPVCRIAQYAFQGRRDIKEVVLNKSMNMIGREAFANCKSLENFDMSATTELSLYNRIFSGCGKLSELRIPGGLRHAGAESFPFEGISGVKTIEFLGIPKNLLGFYDFSDLTEVKLCEGMTEIPIFPDAVSLETITIPASVIVIPSDAFRGCKNLRTVEFPEDSKLERINSRAFYGTAITSLKIPDTVIGIGPGALGNTPIEEFRLPKNVKEETDMWYDEMNPIHYNNLNSILSECYNLKRIIYNSKEQVLALPPQFYLYSGLGYMLYNQDKNIPLYVGEELVTELEFPDYYDFPADAYAFIGGLKKVKTGTNIRNPRYGSIFAYCYDLEEAYIGDGDPRMEHTFMGCKNLRKVEFSEKNYIEKLWETFIDCPMLEEIKMPYVTYISRAFEGCTSLKRVELPELETMDGGENFSNCSSLEELNFPKLKSIGFNEFGQCKNLRKFSAPQCTSIAHLSFKGCESLESLDLGKVEVVGGEAFYNCPSLASFDFSNVKILGSEAFANTGLTEVHIAQIVEDGTVDMGEVFRNCSKLEKFDCVVNDMDVSLSGLSSLKECRLKGKINYCRIGEVSENGADIVIDASINGFTLYGSEPIEKLNFISEMPREMIFSEKSCLKALYCPSLEDYLSVEFFNNAAPGKYKREASVDFYFDGVLAENLEIGEGVDIPPFAFAASTIKSLVFAEGKSPVTVGESAFAFSTQLSEIEINGNVTKIGVNAFQNIGIESIKLPESVKTVGTSCFQQDANLKYAVLSPSIEHINDGMFHNCPKLESVVIPEGAKSMGDRIITYEWDKSVKLISLPSTLQSMYMGYDFSSFDRIPSSIEVYSWAFNPPGMGKATFDKNIVHVPVGSADLYLRERMWMNAKIVDDLLVEEKISKSGQDIVFSIPLNSKLSLELVPVEIEVVVTGPDGVEEVGRWEFSSDNLDDIASLNHVDIAFGNLEEGKHTYKISGYAEKGYKTYMRKGWFDTADVKDMSIDIEAPQSSCVSGTAVYCGTAVELTTSTEYATIYYTTDGSSPANENGTRIKYTEPIVIDDDMKILAVTSVTVNDKEIFSETMEFNYTMERSDMEILMEEGWTWISHNLESSVTLDELFADENIFRIVSQTDEVIRDPKIGMVGTLIMLYASQSYKVETSAATKLHRSNDVAWNPATPLAVRPGWNWLGYPLSHTMTVDEAFATTEAETLDIIEGQSGFAQFNGERWIGTLQTMSPGTGYLYYSQSAKDVIFNTFISSTASPQHVAGIAKESPHFLDIHKYGSVMPVVATINRPDGSQPDNEDYQVTAFSGTECRGVGRVVDGLVMMSVYGNTNDPITFHVTDAEGEMVFHNDVSLNFSETMVGNIFEPFVIAIDEVSGIESAEYSRNIEVSVDGGMLRIKGIAAEDIDLVEIYDLDGRKHVQETSIPVLGISISDLRKGVYFVVVNYNGNYTYHKIAIR